MDRFRTALTHCIALALAVFVAGCAGTSLEPATVPNAQAPIPAPVPVETPEPEALPPVMSPAPAPPPPVSAPAPQVATSTLYKLWYATNRAPVHAKGEVVDLHPKLTHFAA